MRPVSADEVRTFMLDELVEPLSAKGLSPEVVPDDFDLVLEGVIDSLGIVETVAAVEERFGVDLDVEELDPDEVLVVGAFARYVEHKSAAAGARG